jgi:hypothetical protein
MKSVLDFGCQITPCSQRDSARTQPGARHTTRLQKYGTNMELPLERQSMVW